MITLKDLAKQLNVSVSTVSKALSDSDEISKETINRVKELAKNLNYQPNRIALSLKNNQTKTIGVIIPNILNRFFAKALFGIEKEATRLGYNIITCISNEQLNKERDSIELLSNGSVDGFIVAVSEETLVSNSAEHIHELIDKKIPVLLFDRNLEEIDCDKVIIDDFDAANMITKIFVEEEKKNIAFVSTIDDLNVGKLRRKGYESVIESNVELGLKPKYLLLDRSEDYQDKIRTFLKENANLDAIISADNITGTVVVIMANSLGFDIPKKLNVIGFADEVVSNLSVPKLSYIHQNAEVIGEKALQKMVEILKNKSHAINNSTLKIPVELVHKETT